MFDEMAEVGLPSPEYQSNAFMLNVTIKNGTADETGEAINEVINETIALSSVEQVVLLAIKKNPKTTKVEIQEKASLGKTAVDRAIKALKEKGLVQRIGSKKTGYWKIID